MALGCVKRDGKNIVTEVSKLEQMLLLEYKPNFERRLSHSEVEIISRKLLKHYKLKHCTVVFNGRLGRKTIGRCFSYGKIELEYNPKISTLCHEVAHAIAFRKARNMNHNKKFWRICRSVENFCKSRNFWQDEIERRLAPKPIKPEPTKNEQRMVKIEQVREKLNRYRSKVKFYTNKMNKANRSLAMLQRNLNKDSVGKP